MHPDGPCFIIGPRGYFELVPAYASRQKATLVAVSRGFFENITVYDSAGRKWRTERIEPAYQKTWWRSLLASTVNPSVTVTLSWRAPEPYTVEELKGVYAAAVDADDDILTQFVEAEVLKRRIADAGSFGDLVQVYRWMETDREGADSK